MATGIYLALRLQAFTRLSQDDLAAIDQLAKRGLRDIGARRDLLQEGDPPRVVNLILDGWACRYKTLPDGRRQIVGLFLPGDLCDMNVYLLKQMDHNIGAITALRVAEITREDFERLLARHPRLAEALFWNELVTVAIQRECARCIRP